MSNKHSAINIYQHCFGFLVVIAILNTLSCHHPDEPVQPPEPGKRDYTWTVDTLAYINSYQTLMYDIWASSPKDVYTVGHNERGSGCMYHYNGEQWSPVKLYLGEGGLIDVGMDLTAIYGFSSNNIWAVGINDSVNDNPPPNFFHSALIIHYDGTAWRKVDIEKGGSLNTVWGAQPNDVWAGGYKGALYHYNGEVWNKLSFDSRLIFCSISGINASDVYATAQKNLGVLYPLDTLEMILFHYDGLQWAQVDSFVSAWDLPEWKFGVSLWCTKRLYATSYGVYTPEGKAWRELLSSTEPLITRGSSDQNYFAVGGPNCIWHWNGTDWKEFPNLIYVGGWLTGVWTDNHETFIIGMDGIYTYVLHGK